jgi:uncharacterized RDD family membrane protein YckC
MSAPANSDSEGNQSGGIPFARAGRRFLAITADWLMSWAVGSLFFAQEQGRPFWIALVFFLQISLLTATTGASAGQRIFKLQVVSYPSLLRLGFLRTILRTFLILLVIPAVVYDSDGRGLHDRIANSAVLHTSKK